MLIYARTDEERMKKKGIIIIRNSTRWSLNLIM